MLTKENKVITGASYWQAFRLIFVVFSFYLLGDALYRWNGFSYYSSFSEFLPSVALVSIIWSFIAVLYAYLVWLPVKVISLFSSHRKWKYSDRVQLFVYILVLLLLFALSIKRIIWLDLPTSLQLKLTVFIGITLVTVLLTVAIEWFSLRNKWKNPAHIMHFIYIFVLIGGMVWIARQLMLFNVPASFQWGLLQLLGITLAAIFLNWLFREKSEVIQKQIALWVWLFGIFVIFSVPLVAYKTWWEKPDKVEPYIIAPSNVSGKDRPNIILVTFDALTTKDMSVYGYNRLTTPFINEWARKASLFSRAKAAGNSTSSTTSSLMTGKRIWSHGVFQPHGYIINKVNTQNLPLLLKQNDYYNMAYVSTKFAAINNSGIRHNFDISPHDIIFKTWLQFIGRIDLKLYKLFGEKIRLYDWIIKRDFIFGKFLRFVNKNILQGKNETILYDTKKVFNKFFEDIDSNPQEPFFAWIHLYPPHIPYSPPEPYKGIFESTLNLNGKNLTKEEIKHHNVLTERARYDELIMFCDKQFEEFIENLSLRDKLKNTAIIFSSDHGELFEDFFIGHVGPYLYEPITSIPLIIKDPDREGGQIINDLVAQIDIPATILDFAHIPVPSWLEGRSLIPLMRGDTVESRPAFSMNLEKSSSRDHQITKGTIVVWDGDYKLIHYLTTEESQLFNLRDDPGELNNLFYSEPEVGQFLLKIILDNLNNANERMKNR